MRHCLPAPSLTRDNAFKTRAEKPIATRADTIRYGCRARCILFRKRRHIKIFARRRMAISRIVPRKCRIRRDNRGGIRETHPCKKRKSRSPTASHQRIRSYTGRGLLFACVLLSASLSVPRKKGLFLSMDKTNFYVRRIDSSHFSSFANYSRNSRRFYLSR